MKNVSYFGIDFGTTNTSVVQIFVDEYDKKVIHLGENGDNPFSSIVAIPKNGNQPLMFGEEVRKRRLELSKTHYVYLSMKSFLGTDKEFIAENKSYSATDIVESFLKYIKSYIKEHYQLNIHQASFSYPIDFPSKARKELYKSAIGAKIIPNNFINEATSAYIANREQGRLFSNAMVIDWGGGTLDISVLEIGKSKISELCIVGEKIGGDDIDLAIAKQIHNAIANKSTEHFEFEDMSLKEQDQMIYNCEQGKIHFSNNNDDYMLTVTDYGFYETKTIKVTYSFFEKIVTSIVKNKVLKVINEALEGANMTKANIDAVIIVGGSSQLKPFSNAIYNFFDKEKVIFPRKTKWCVAEGAAWLGIINGAFKLNNTLGILLSNEMIYPTLKKNIHGINSEIKNIKFALVEDTLDANFIFVNEDKEIYDIVSVPTKGFLKEEIFVSAKISIDHIARITIKNNAMGINGEKTLEITQLPFYYDLSTIIQR